MPSKKKIAAKEVESKLSSLPKSKGLSAQPSPSSRMEIESIKSKGLVAKSPMDDVKKSLTPSPEYSGYSEAQINGIFSGYQMKAKEKKLPAIEVDRRKQEIMGEYKKNRASGSTKSMNYNAMPVKNEQAKSIMDTENQNLKIGNAKKTEKYIK